MCEHGPACPEIVQGTVFVLFGKPQFSAKIVGLSYEIHGTFGPRPVAQINAPPA